MFGYIVKRVLLMVPTFFAVSLVVFIVLNFAPGNPAQVALASGDGNSGQSTQLSNQTRESYRLFKEQFNLDKPILFNTRFGLKTETVRQTLDDLLRPPSEVAPARRSEAEDEIENWGQYAIPALVEILKSDSDRTMRAFASQRLAVNSQRAVIVPSRGPLTDEERAHNKAVARGNGEAVKWTFRPGDDAEREGAVTAFWVGWYDDNIERWTWNGTVPHRRRQ